MLIYNPAFDLYHFVYRHIAILDKMPSGKTVRFDEFRLVDFYYLFPQELRKVKFPSSIISYKKILPKDDNPFSRIRNPSKVFKRMEPLENNSINFLLSLGLIDKSNYDKSKILRTNIEFPSVLLEKINENRDKEFDVLWLLTHLLLDKSIVGEGGLRSRSPLIESRYESI